MHDREQKEHEESVQSKSQREKIFSDIPLAFRCSRRVKHSRPTASTTSGPMRLAGMV